jgi:hypothetical protein
MGEKRIAYRLLVRKPEVNRPLGRPGHRWICNIKVDLVQIGWSGLVWIGLAQDMFRWTDLVNEVMNLRVLQNTGKLPSGCTTCGPLPIYQILKLLYLLEAK